MDSNGMNGSLSPRSSTTPNFIPFLPGLPSNVVPIATGLGNYNPTANSGGSEASTSYGSQHHHYRQHSNSLSGGVQANAGFEYGNGNNGNADASGSGGGVTAIAAGQQGQTKANKSRAIQSCAECKAEDQVQSCRALLVSVGETTPLLSLTKSESPGGPCILRGEEVLCREVEKVEPVHMPVPTMDDFKAAVKRIMSLEDSMIQLQKLLAANAGQATPAASLPQEIGITRLPPMPVSIKRSDELQLNSASIGTAAPMGNRRAGGNDSSAGGGRENEDMAMMLEDFAMNNRANRDRAVKIMGASTQNSGSVVETQQAHKSPNTPRLPGIMHLLPSIQDPSSTHNNIALLESSHPLSSVISPDVDYISRFIAQAPDPLRGWQLVQFYFTHLEWYTRVLHAPNFIEECKHLLSLPPQSVSGRVRPSFLATYFIVICIALQYIGDREKADLGFSNEQAHSMCISMFSAAQGMLHLVDFLAAHSLEHLQVIVLMGVYQYNVGQADSHWSLLGSAIKIAQNIGLSRLGSERDDIKWPEAWHDPLRREIGRRVWWNLIFLDWSHATAHNACYSIHPSQNFTDFPANVDDVALRDGTAVLARPMEQHTDTTFTICKMKFVSLYRELVDHQLAHNPPSYAFILDMDTRVVRTLDSLPSFFRGATPPASSINDATVMECLLIQLIGETRLLRLHRPYLSRGYRERTYSPSKDRCVHSARSILVLLKTAEKASPILLKTWLVLFYGFGAAVVTFIDLCHGKVAGDEAACQQKRQQIRDMTVLLQSAKNISDAARSATALLEGLLAAEEEVSRQERQPIQGGNKRKADLMDDEDPFKRVVKKLLTDSAPNPPRFSEASPSTSTSSTHMSPAYHQQLLQSQRNAPLPPPSASVTGYANLPLHPPPFQPDLDLFLEGSKSYTQSANGTNGQQPLYDGLVDPTAADLSHLFMDDIITNMFSGNSGMTGGNDSGLGNGW